jgi:hypothetical protein
MMTFLHNDNNAHFIFCAKDKRVFLPAVSDARGTPHPARTASGSGGDGGGSSSGIWL